MQLPRSVKDTERSNSYSWVWYMEKCNQDTFQIIDNICSVRKDVNTMDFLYKLKSSIVLRKKIIKESSLTENDLTIFFDDVFFPIQPTVENTIDDIRKVTSDFLEYKNRNDIFIQLTDIIYWDNIDKRISLKFFEHISSVYNIWLNELLQCIKKINLNNRQKHTMKLIIKSKNSKDIRKYMALSIPELDRELCLLNIK